MRVYCLNVLFFNTKRSVFKGLGHDIPPNIGHIVCCRDALNIHQIGLFKIGVVLCNIINTPVDDIARCFKFMPINTKAIQK